MATVTVSIKPKAGGVRLATWTALGNADTGSAIQIPDYPDKTVEILGTWGSATAVVEGSSDGTTYTTLKDIGSTALSFTADSGPKVILENPLFIRVSTSGGTGTDLDAIITTAK